MLERYRTALLAQARRRTRRLLKKAAPGATLTLTIWSKEHQDALLACGWTPLSESPRIDTITGDTWTEMTMTITKHLGS